MRKSGILLHPTSFPGPGGIGSLGKYARAFIDFLHASGQSLWQILPTGPTAYGNSPYACYSAFAGNPLLIDLETLVAEGDLASSDLRHDLPGDRVDYQLVENYKFDVLAKAASTFFAGSDHNRQMEYKIFCERTWWLHDYALFMAIKESNSGLKWSEWPADAVRREPSVLNQLSEKLSAQIESQKYMQWQFSRQWRQIKQYANRKGIQIIGDIPIFVAYDSADVWANPQLFHLDEKKNPIVVAGVPPDYFSKTGQLWGNPLYNWDVMAKDGYEWWIRRFMSCLQLCDIVRVDHFRGFEAYWEVPAGEKTAMNGCWVKGPGEAFFVSISEALGSLPILAEDLGVITPEVELLRDKFSFPGMKILHFAFGSGPQNPYLPHNHKRECVVYTGTHDNDTTIGWYDSLPEKDKKEVCRYLDKRGDDIAWDLIKTALVSVADTAIIPLQDILSLPSEARMNTPGTSTGNWTWRFHSPSLTAELASNLLELVEMYGRSPQNK